MITLFVILALFQLKHFIADYPLQGTYMLGKFKGGWEWVKPLLAHVAVHAVFTTTIVSFFRPSLWWLGLLDAFIHFTMDRIKASPNLLGRFKPDNKYFWWALGFDQMVHHLTDLLVVFLLFTI